MHAILLRDRLSVDHVRAAYASDPLSALRRV
jgi:hypothetical protein